MALVTGGSKGIGKAVALSLAREGSSVAICARGEALLKQTSEQIQRETGSKVAPFVADLTRMEDVIHMVEGVVSHFGRIDILVNNAGSAPGGLLEGLTEDDWNRHCSSSSWVMCAVARQSFPTCESRGGGGLSIL